jgi:probable rRNA maturation factor
VSLESRFDQLLIHGILHLFGFDHEQTAEDSEMTVKEEQLLELL